MRFLFVDRIVESIPGELIRGVKHVTRDDAFLHYDAQGRAYFPSSLIGETLGQLAAWNVMLHNNFQARPVAGVVASARLFRPAYVGDTLLLESFIDCLDEAAVQYHSVARINDDIVFTVEGALGPLLPMANFIDDTVVRQQFEEINRPGDWSALSFSPTVPLENTPVFSPTGAAMTFDRIVSCSPGVAMIAEKRISRSASYFADHFPKNPVLPMTVLLECKLALAEQFLQQSAFAERYQVVELRKIKMNEFVHPGDVIICHLKVKHQDAQQLVLTYRSEVEGQRVCVLELVMAAEGSSYE